MATTTFSRNSFKPWNIHECDFFEIICFVESSDIYNEILSSTYRYIEKKKLIFLQSY